MIRSTYQLEGEAKIAARAQLAETQIKPHLQLLDDVIAKYGGGEGYTVHGVLTIADIMVYAQMAWYQTGFYEGVPTNMHESFPNICKVMETVKALPQVAEFEAKH
jgi:glutathione S-transferase